MPPTTEDRVTVQAIRYPVNGHPHPRIFLSSSYPRGKETDFVTAESFLYAPILSYLLLLGLLWLTLVNIVAIFFFQPQNPLQSFLGYGVGSREQQQWSSFFWQTGLWYVRRNIYFILFLNQTLLPGVVFHGSCLLVDHDTRYEQKVRRRYITNRALQSQEAYLFPYMTRLTLSLLAYPAQ